ncbi:hypothetical protein COCNU_11G013560 [Cocos nucifera]|uniref:Uncharacterized protein n=1 Tax=Cocos nucifera TaxID=13894 RepID=A0A8K0IS41_COCNU|nr:hypothetical protein COCNU_11G013560 [Cocos nucifera]
MVGSSGKAPIHHPIGVDDHPSGASKCRIFNDWEMLHFFVELSNHLLKAGRVGKLSLRDVAQACRQAKKEVGKNRHLKEALYKAAFDYEEKLQEAMAKVVETDAKVVETEQEIEASVRRVEKQVTEVEHRIEEWLAEAH